MKKISTEELFVLFVALVFGATTAYLMKRMYMLTEIQDLLIASTLLSAWWFLSIVSFLTQNRR